MIDYVKFATLPVFDQDRALAFYTRKLGLVLAMDQPFQAGLRWIELTIQGARTRLWFGARKDDQRSAEPSLIFITADLQSTYETLAARGVEFVQPPTDSPWSPGDRHALLRDSEGNMIMLAQSQ